MPTWADAVRLGNWGMFLPARAAHKGRFLAEFLPRRLLGMLLGGIFVSDVCHGMARVRIVSELAKDLLILPCDA